MVILVAGVFEAPAQEAAVPDVTRPKQLTIEEAEQARANLDADGSIDPSVKGPLLARYEQTLKLLREREELDEATAGFNVAIEQAPPETTEVQAELAEAESQADQPRPVPEGTLDEIQTEVESTQTRIDGLQNEVDRLSASSEEIQRRPVAISERIPEIQSELAQVQSRLEAPELSGNDLSPGRLADRHFLQASRQKLESEARTLEAEERSHAERAALTSAQLRLAEIQLEQERTYMNALQQKLREIVRSEVDRLAREVADAGEDQGRSSLPRQLAQEIQALVVELEDVISKTNRATLIEASIEQKAASFRREFELVQAQLEVGKPGEELAPVFFNLSRRLRTQPNPEEFVTTAEAQLNEARLAALLVEDNIRRQRELEQRAGPDPDVESSRLLSLRRNVLEKLRVQYRALIRELARLVTDSRNYVQAVEGGQRYLSEKLFLVRSASPLGWETFARLPEAIAWFFKPDHLVRLGTPIVTKATQQPLQTGLVVILLTGLLLLRPRIIQAIEATGQRVRRISEDSYGQTLIALGYSILLALPLPLLLLYFYAALTTAPASDDWVWSIRYVLPLIATITFVALFIAAICREGGLWQHFGWQGSSVQMVRRGFIQFVAAYIAGGLMVSSTVYSRDAEFFDSLGRLAFMAVQLWTAYLIWRLLASKDGMLARAIREHPQRIGIRWRRVWMSLAIGFPAFLALLAGVGFIITAVEMSAEALTVAGLIALGAFSYWMVLRWFTIRERRLAVNERLERWRKARQASGDEDSPEVVAFEEEESGIDLDSIGDQTRRLLRSSFVLGTAAIVVSFLSTSVPFLSAIDQWQVVGHVSLLELIQMILVLLATIVASINIPGLLELALLRPMGVSPGTRHAIETLVQYALITTGAVILLAIIQIDWVQFGWILAALSVGIGFGLQEVFSNFVCGILLLFERPIRVGDIVTIEGTTGTVAKIQMRATTIVNWDRQELVVPNKNFITGTLLNWSLSNAMNRLTIPVGVAYGSDTTKALEILARVADKHPLILPDPQPLVTFEGFGDSTLNLVLRCYLPDLDNRLAVMTDLHQTIDRDFAAAGIVIAFPQRDLNLGSGWEKLAPKAGPESAD